MTDDRKTVLEKFNDLRESYIAGLPEKLASIDEAWAAFDRGKGDPGQLETFHRLVHGVAGSGGTFGFADLSIAGRNLEVLIKTLREEDHLISQDHRNQVKRLMTDLHTLARDLRDLERKYRGVVNDISIGIVLVDRDMKILSLNPRIYQWFPQLYEGADWGKHFEDFQDDDGSAAPWILCLRDGWVHESVMKTPADDDVRYYRIVSSPILDENGEVVNMIQMVEDISERMRAEEALRKSEKPYRDLFESISDFIYTHDFEGRILSINPVAADSLGYTPEEVIGRPLGDFMLSEYRQDFHDEYMQQIRSQGSSKGVTIFLAKDGSRHYIEYRSALVKMEGEVPYVSGFGRDITERLHAERALEADNIAKSEFLANMSHEIRTPMTAVIGMADLLWETTLTDEQKKFVETIRSSGENLLRLINDILDLSKIGAGQIKLERSPFNLMDVVNNACETQALSAQEKGLKLRCQVGTEVETFILGDPIRLSQILSNLIGNAVKFTENGEVSVEVRRLEVQGQTMAESAGSGLQQEPGRTTELLFSVTDTGIGIPPEKMETIFDRFSQADSSTTRKYGGTGIGLAISRGLAKLMEGRVWVESEVGQGSTFFFTAKFEVQSETEHVEASEAAALGQPMVTEPSVHKDLSPLHILFVEDNEKNRVIIQVFLKDAPYTVDTAENGEVAVEKFTTGQYDLVLMDIEMPVMDGYVATGKIRQWETENNAEATPIIALSAHALVEHSQKSFEAGCTAHLAKPIKKEDLLKAIEKYAIKNKS